MRALELREASQSLLEASELLEAPELLEVPDLPDDLQLLHAPKAPRGSRAPLGQRGYSHLPLLRAASEGGGARRGRSQGRLVRGGAPSQRYVTSCLSGRGGGIVQHRWSRTVPFVSIIAQVSFRRLRCL